ncbi:MAG: hypothetical protein AB7T63_18100 [Planctomycetota bacterium]
MFKRLSLFALVLVAGASLAGCNGAAAGLETLSGRDCQGCGSWGDKNNAILGQWARDARHNERLIDKHFLNYDIDDPYRGDCLVGY